MEIRLNADGTFFDCFPVEKEPTIVPVTEDSASRTSKEEPHPLEDSLKYIATGLVVKNGEKGTTDYEKHHRAYVNLLTDWVSREPHEKTTAILTYILGGTMLTDLRSRGILKLNDDGSFETTEAISKYAKTPDAVFVRFSVLHTTADDSPIECWRDKSLFASWQRYCASQAHTIGLCYATGTNCALSEKHRKFIRNPGDGAKLISANDRTDYTYRGLFYKPEQARGVSGDVSQKAHLALKWLIARQGCVWGDLVFVCWPKTDAKNAVKLDEDFVREGNEEEANVFEQAEEEIVCDTEQEYAQTVAKYLRGYRASIMDGDKPEAEMLMIGVDSVTPGRMAVVYFREMGMDAFFRRVNDWYTTCCWELMYSKGEDKKKQCFKRIGTPTPADIGFAAYGYSKDQTIRKQKAILTETIMHCILDGAKIPYEAVRSAVNRCIKRTLFDSWYEWMRSVQITCALYKKYREKEHYTMALDESLKNRDYLFGRLLAVVDLAEERALKEQKEERMTNAQRHLERFANAPTSTFRSIRLNLESYLGKLQYGGYYRKKIDDILELFEIGDFDDRPLSGEFLLGYSHQRSDLFKKRDTQTTEEQK